MNAEDWTGLSGSLFAQTGKEIVAPRINKLLDKLERKALAKFKSRKSHFKSYWFDIYGRFYTVNSVIFGNSQRVLREIYVPMKIKVENDGETLSVNHYPVELLDKYGRIVINDCLGMGKSTMMKIMFMDVIDRCVGYPIFVELRDLSENNGLISKICKDLGCLGQPFDYNLFFEIIRQGDFIFFLDGFDEVKDENKAVVIKDLCDFLGKTKNCRFVITSRKMDSLAGLGSFQGVNVMPLEKGDLFVLILRYGKNSHEALELIEKIKRHDYYGIDDFLKNPLLAGLLYKAYSQSQGFKLKPAQLCCNILPVFYEQHDKSKDTNYTHDKKTKLTVFDMDKLLRLLGLYWKIKNFRSVDYDQFCRMMEFVCNQFKELNVNANNLKEDLLMSIPLFCKDGLEYRWIHDSLCDYYMAKYIWLDSKEKMPNMFQRIINSPDLKKYELVLRMYVDMDENGFRMFVLKPVIDSYRNYASRNKEHSLAEFMEGNNGMHFLVNILYDYYPDIFIYDEQGNGQVCTIRADEILENIIFSVSDESVESLIGGL